MTSRVEQRFADLKQANQGGLVIFVTAGDPDPDTFDSLLEGLPAAGADIIEIGMPFSDPMADGPAIQLANLRALDAGMTLRKTLEAVERFREKDTTTPIVLMGYYNPIYSYGVTDFVRHAESVGVDGLIVVDLPAEEDSELCHPAMTAGLHWIRLATPTSDDNRLDTILVNTSGFVYYVSVAGITGTRSAAQTDISDAVARLRRHTDLPVAVGFGIKTPEQAAAVASVADAAVVGSAVVDQIKSGIEAGEDGAACVKRVHQLVSELSAGVKGARS